MMLCKCPAENFTFVFFTCANKQKFKKKLETDWLSDLKRGACPLLLATEKKPLWGEKSRQLAR